MHVQSWMNLAERAAPGGHMLFLEDGPEIFGAEQSEEDHGEVLERMYASGCRSIDQARATAEQAEELRR
jgi:hypothetical protein